MTVLPAFTYRSGSPISSVRGTVVERRRVGENKSTGPNEIDRKKRSFETCYSEWGPRSRLVLCQKQIKYKCELQPVDL